MQTVSIYKKFGEESLADLLRKFSSVSEPENSPESQGVQGEVREYKMLREKLDLYLQGADFGSEIFGDDKITEVISNAMILERLKVEAIEVLGQNEELTDEQRKGVLAAIFGDGSKYKKLYDKYYQPSGLVEEAQKFLKDKKIEPIFKCVAPAGLSSTSFNLTKDVFKNISDMKSSIKLNENHDRSFVISTIAFDKEDLNFTMMGLLASDPRQLGAILAVMGNKEKQGEIMMEEDNRYNVGMGSVKGVGNMACRCLIALAVIACYAYIGYIFGAAAITGSGAAAILGTTTALKLVGAFILGTLGFTHIRTKVKDEEHITSSILTSSAHTNPGGSGISGDDIYKFIVAPFIGGRNADIEAACKSDFEKKLLSMQGAIDVNRNIYRGLKNSEDKTKFDTITHKKECIEFIRRFGLTIKGKETQTQLTS